MEGAVFCWVQGGWPPLFIGWWLVFVPVTPALRTHDFQIITAEKGSAKEV